MGSIQWDDSLSIGIEVIDDQHRALIERLNQVSEALEVFEGETEIQRTLGFLTEYAVFHFADEEKHMAAHNYRGLAEQQTRHAEFVETLKSLERDFEEEGSTRALAEAINTFLSRWLREHIRGLDRQFGTFLEREGLSLD